MIGNVDTSGGFGGLVPAVGARVEAFGDGGFGAELVRWSERAKPGIMTEADARGAAEELVAMTFVQPVLKQMREMNNAEPPFTPGIAERRFGALWDTEIAQRIVRARGFGLVDAVARDVLSKARMGAPSVTQESTNHAKPGTETINTIG